MLNQTEYATSTVLVQKRVFALNNLELECGSTLTDVRFGFECYGQLNSSRDNAILIPHYFTGSSHVAGRYRESDLEPGYWDLLVGPGKAIDTNRYFVIGVDCLGNVNTGNPDVVTTGPKSINPATGQIYGDEFPELLLTDSVRAQCALVDSLGIETLHAVCGPSMGSMQALTWAAVFPDRVKKVVGVIGGGLATEPYLIALLEQWCIPVRYDRTEGLINALELVTLNALSPNWGYEMFAKYKDKMAILRALRDTAKARAAVSDPESFLRLARTVQKYDIRAKADRIKAEILWVPSRSDALIFPQFAERGIGEMKSLGLRVTEFWLESDGGHLDGLHAILPAAGPISQFLSKP